MLDKNLKNSVKLILGYEKKVYAIESWRLFFSQFIDGFNFLYASGVYKLNWEDTLILESIAFSSDDILNVIKLGNIFRILESQESIIIELTLQGLSYSLFIENDSQYENLVESVKTLEF